jgi:polyisoprenoid-binding protein YceI
MKRVVGREEVDPDRLVGHWVLDGALSRVRFTERILWGLVKVRGRFADFNGSATVELGGRVTGSVSVETGSLDTENKKRDEHLRSPDFFDVERYPLITARVSGFTSRGDPTDLHASLAIKGVHEPITLTVSVEDVTADTIRLRAQADVDRGRFGMTWKKLGATGRATIVADAVFRRSAE